MEEEPKAYPEVGAGLLREVEEVVEVRSRVEVEGVEVPEMQDKEEAEEVESLHLVVVEEVEAEVQFPLLVVVEQHQLLQVPPQPVKGLKSFRDKKGHLKRPLLAKHSPHPLKFNFYTQRSMLLSPLHVLSHQN